MQLAVSGMKVSATAQRDDLQRRGTWFSAPLAAAPHTKVEQYWAARALVAETLLSARDRHQVDLAEMRRMEAEKREGDIRAILDANDQKQRGMMVLCLVVLLGFMAPWLVMNADAKGKTSHFTIPILSPFASVVEHETGVFGTKAVVVFIVVIGFAMYAGLKRRWQA